MVQINDRNSVKLKRGIQYGYAKDEGCGVPEEHGSGRHALKGGTGGTMGKDCGERDNQNRESG